MQVDVLCGRYLRVTTAGGTAFDAEVWAKRRFADAEYGLLAQSRQGVSKPDGDSRLALASPCWGDCGNKNEVSVGLVFSLIKNGERQFGDVLAVGVDDIGVEPKSSGNFCYR
jgi:hypothetical protein